MDFSWSKEQLALKEEVVQLVQEKLSIARDTSIESLQKLWKQCAELGIQGLATVAKYGGRATTIDMLSAVLAMEGFGYACHDNGLAFGLNAQMWTVQFPIYKFGSQAQQEQFLPALTKGEKMGALAMTEPEAGSDVFNMQTTAIKKDQGYVLNGTKCLITMAPIADVIIVLANVNPAIGKWGITAFLIEKGTPGLSLGEPQEKMGLNTIPFGSVFFEDCWVSEDARLGKEGAGFALVNYILEYERCCIFASQIGAMERQLEQVINFANERKQFGKAIGTFQSVSNRVVDMKLRLETARLLLYKAAWLKTQDKSALQEVSLLKLHLSESFLSSSLDAMRTYGGKGYLTDFGAEQDVRDAIGGVFYSGTSDIQRNIIAKLLGL